MVVATKNELIKSDVIVPESDLQTMRTIDNVSKNCSRQLMENATNEMSKALITSRSIKQFRELLSDTVMSDIMLLMNTPLGFKTDRPNNKDNTYYPKDIVRDCLIQVFLRGLRVIGNEFNIIAGSMYVTKEGFERLLNDMPQLTELKIQIGVPHSSDTGALVSAKASWKLNGATDEMVCEKTDTGDYRVAVKVNAGMGPDAMIGKARSKVLRNIYARISGTKLAVEAEADEVEVVEVVK